MAFNFSEKPTEIRSRKTGKPYVFVCASGAQLGETAVTQIANVCDEPEIYDNVFAAIFKGKRYSEDNARTFTKLVSEGWNKNRFDWLILSEGAVVGTVGIKSLDGEIGHWQSNKHPSLFYNLCRKNVHPATSSARRFEARKNVWKNNNLFIKNNSKRTQILLRVSLQKNNSLLAFLVQLTEERQ